MESSGEASGESLQEKNEFVTWAEEGTDIQGKEICVDEWICLAREVGTCSTAEVEEFDFSRASLTGVFRRLIPQQCAQQVRGVRYGLGRSSNTGLAQSRKQVTGAPGSRGAEEELLGP